MSGVNDELAQWIEQRLDHVFAAPRMWGGFEAVEMQALLLFELLAFVRNPQRERESSRHLLDQYNAYLSRRFTGSAAMPLHQMFAVEDESKFVEALRAFKLWQESSLLPENPFEHSEVAIELTYAAPLPSVASFTGYYEAFRKATRAIVRTGDVGRPSKAIGLATDFALENVRVRPQNGLPASVLLQLGRGFGQIDTEADRQVRDAITGLVTMAEWADSDAEVDALNIDDVDARTLTAVQTLRVVPQRGIESVHIGGRLIGRSKPAVLRPRHQKRLIDVASAGSSREPFDQVEEVRAIDLDRGFFRLGQKPGIECYAPLEQLEQVSRVGIRARIVGEQFRPSGSKRSFVIVDAIEFVSNEED